MKPLMRKEFFSKNLFPNAISLLTNPFRFGKKIVDGLRLGLVDNLRVPKTAVSQGKREFMKIEKNYVFTNLWVAADQLNN